MNGSRPTFTIFTPTYNRGAVLSRMYGSLAAQQFRDFEWLIVDNASTDDTEQVVEAWIQEGRVAIRYLRNEVNIGRQRSWLRAIDAANGEFFIETRSADEIVPEALARLKHHWDSIPEAERESFSAVTALAVDEYGRLQGTPFPRDVVDADSISIRFRYKVKGDKFGFQRLDVLRSVDIPTIPGYLGEIPSRIVWRAIARRYRTRYVNERLRIFWQDQGHGLSRPRIPWSNAPGRVLDSEDLLVHDLAWLPMVPLTFYREAVAYVCSSFHIGQGLRPQALRLVHLRARLLWLAAVPVGTMFYLVQRFAPAVGRRLPNP